MASSCMAAAAAAAAGSTAAVAAGPPWWVEPFQVLLAASSSSFFLTESQILERESEAQKSERGGCPCVCASFKRRVRSGTLTLKRKEGKGAW